MKNPFNFLRKKNSFAAVAREKNGLNGHSSAVGIVDQRKQSSVTLASKYASPASHFERSRNHSSSTLNLAAGGISTGPFGAGNFYMPSSVSRSRTKGGSELHAVGIDEEQPGVEGKLSHGTASHGHEVEVSKGTSASVKEKKRRLVRPMTRDRDRGRNGSDDMSVGAANGQTPTFGCGSMSESTFGRRRQFGGSSERSKNVRRDTPTATRTNVEMTLDTNFDQIEDIVDTSMRQNAQPVGSMSEKLQDGLRSSSPGMQAQYEQFSLAQSTSWASSSARAPSDTMVPDKIHNKAQFAEYRAELSALWLQAPPTLQNAAMKAHSLHRTADQQIDLSKPGIRKVSLAEVQRLTAVSSAQDGALAADAPMRTRAGSAAGRLDKGIGADTASLMSGYEEYPSRLDAATTQIVLNDAKDQRKDSAASRVSAQSGVSPKTSAVNLARTYTNEAVEGGSVSAQQNDDASSTWSQQDFTLNDYQFPSRQTLPADTALRKSSMGSAGTAAAAAFASTWMAPDSWAVQPDNDRDHLRDEDDSGQDDSGHSTEDETTQAFVDEEDTNLCLPRAWKLSEISSADAQAVPRNYSHSMSSGGGRTNQSHRPSGGSGSRDVSLALPRGSQVSSGSSPVSESIMNPCSVELRSSSDALASSTTAFPFEAHRPTTPTTDRASMSRGGALGVAGCAAAAAANMLGLRSKQKHGASSSSQPGTAIHVVAASAGAMAALGGGDNSRPATDDDSVTSNSAVSPDLSASIASVANTKGGLASSKRAGLMHQSSQYGVIGGKNYILRIDTPFGTRKVFIPLHTTASGLRAIIGRKSPSGARSYRLFVQDKGSERPLGESEKPPLLQRRRMEQAGYTEYDSLETLGREDHSYLLRFVYRPDLVPTFDSEQFGNTEDNYTHLDLQSRNLEMVPIFLYRHADWINSLDLSGNPMSDIPSDFVQLCTNLRTLRLSDLALKRIPQSIRHSKTLTHLDLSNNRIPDISHIMLEQIPQLKSLKLQNNRLTELPASLDKLLSLKQLNISNNRFDTFPGVICEVPSLTDLDFSFNSVAVLPDQLGRLRNLESLILVGNSIEQLPACISALASLRKIDIRRNLLQDVTSLFLIQSLGEVQCEHNSIKSLSASLSVNLRSINLGHNPLSRVAIGSSSVASQLVCLNLSTANLSKLDDALLTQLTSLFDLILDRNQFVVLPDSIGDLKELRLLSCTNNHLAALPDSVGKLSKLKRLLVHNNNLSSLPQTIWHCSSLTSINASSNLLESFPLPDLTEGNGRTVDAKLSHSSNHLLLDHDRNGSGASMISASVPATPSTSAMPSKLVATPLGATLKKLRLADNRLTDDVFDAIGLLTEVEVLNLSFNDIYEIPGPSLSKLPQLRELYLSGNDLSSLPTDDLLKLRLLRILHLNANRLQTLPAELGQLRTMANLDVGNNSLKYNIANWHYDWNWNSNPELRYLNLSGNKRLDIKSKMSAISGAGRRMDTSDFQRLISLRVLGLMDVTVTLPQMPDENENRRVRTSLSQVNGMAYGISDALGRFDNLSLVDVVVPNFRQDPKECLIGLFEGRNHGAHTGSRVAKFLGDWASHRVEREVFEILTGAGGVAGTRSNSINLAGSPNETQIPHIMRRAFLRLQQEYAILLMSEGGRGGSDGFPIASTADDVKINGQTATAWTNKTQWQAGASGVLVYIVDRWIHVANAGDALAVLSQGGTAHHMTTRHEPFDREETLRIRSAEGWVSLRGYVNDSLDVSRSFGYYHLTPFVNAAPAVQSIQLDDSDEFLIIASRALWDQMSYQTAVDIARTERDDLMIAAQKLRDFAISYGAEESIMVMIVAVGDLFESRQDGRAVGGSRFDPTTEAFKKTHRRDREMLPSDRTLARLEREVAPPIGHVALVFTDIKNSTSLWETNGGMQSAMRLHNILLRRQLRVVGGYEVKTEGDAFMVSFPSVSSALIWCFNVQIQLLREDWPQEILESEDGKEVRDLDGNVIYRGLSVRMGIHWGWPVCENDPVTRRMDYFGPMVNRAARISGAADGGQIMASRDVVNELTALLGTFDETGGPIALLSDSADVTAEGELADFDEDAFRLLHPSVTRDVVLLRRMGFGISEVGERKLKGLETPEMLNLVYPKQLSGRMATREDAPAPKVFEPTPSLLNIEEIKTLGMLCLRLEALSNAQLFPGVLSESSALLGGDADKVPDDTLTSASAQVKDAATILHPAANRPRAMEKYLALKPELLIVSIRDDDPDDELATLLEQLVIRIRNALTAIALRRCLKDGTSAATSAASSAVRENILNLLCSEDLW